jgi:hypothetical protein
MKDGAIKYSGALDALRSIVRVEGVGGLYRGLWPNLRECLCAFRIFAYGSDDLCS